MNIFYVDGDATVAAQNLVDKHICKMVIEVAQLLCTAHRVLDGEKQPALTQTGRKTSRWVLPDARDNILYVATHLNHPSAIWSRENAANYTWLYEHFLALGREYTHRYGKVHLTITKLKDALAVLPNNIDPSNTMTLMPSCMDKQYVVSECPITNYRNYYQFGKSDLHRWTKRLPPAWIQGKVILLDSKKMIHIIE
jgi:hypothetical protein